MHRGLTAFLIASTVASQSFAASQKELDSLASEMGVRIAILDNHPPHCPGQTDGCFLSELELAMPRSLAPDLASGKFRLFFSSVNPVIEGDSDAFTVRLINGDLHVLEPRPGVTLQPGKTYTVKLWSQGHFFSAYYVIPNIFLVSGNLVPRVIAATRPVTDPESGLEALPFVAPMTDEARLATQAPGDQTRWQTPQRAFDVYASRGGAAAAEVAIIPMPAVVNKLPGAAIDLAHGVRLNLSGVGRPAIDSAIRDLAATGVQAGAKGAELRVRVAPTLHLNPEAYRLAARNGRIDISALDAAGARYALESLAQEVAHEHGSLRPIEVEGAPRFGFRGLRIDLARHFHRQGEVLQVIDQLG